MEGWRDEEIMHQSVGRGIKGIFRSQWQIISDTSAWPTSITSETRILTSDFEQWEKDVFVGISALISRDPVTFSLIKLTF